MEDHSARPAGVSVPASTGVLTGPGIESSASTANAEPESRTAILDDSEAAARVLVLAELQAALAGLGIQSVLARRRRLVLRYNDPGPLAPSGPVDPALHVFMSGGAVRVVATDRACYRLDTGQELSVSAPADAAAAICQPLHATAGTAGLTPPALAPERVSRGHRAVPAGQR